MSGMCKKNTLAEPGITFLIFGKRRGMSFSAVISWQTLVYLGYLLIAEETSER